MSDNYKELVKNLIVQYMEMKCRMSIKLHYQHSHLDYFRQNLGDVSEKHGERFHQDILAIEKRYQGRWKAAMMDDNICCLIRDDDNLHKRRKTFQCFLLTFIKNDYIVCLHICILVSCYNVKLPHCSLRFSYIVLQLTVYLGDYQFSLTEGERPELIQVASIN